jgi:phage terminase large subunit
MNEMAPIAAAPEIDFPEKLQPLFQPKRYKIIYGGRGGAKSWGIARALLLIGAERKLRVLCARELQSSIQDSVHALLTQQVDELGLNSIYTPEKARLYSTVTGTDFSFEGIRYNTPKIKSYEGVDVCWIEEAAKVTKSSMEIIVPTIRKEGSEIWLSLNPEHETDYIYTHFVLDPPLDSTVIKMNWRDNPWFPQVLRRELEELKRKDYDAYLHVWEGHCKQMLQGSIYAEQVRAALDEGRITRVPYERLAPVSTFWDLGKRDKTSIWFAQAVGFQYRIIDFYENTGKDPEHYLQVLQNKGYVYDRAWLPHDARAKIMGMKRTVQEQIRDHGFNVKIVPNIKREDGIAAARTIFSKCWFDLERTRAGMNHLKHYRYEVSDTGAYSTEPVHDDHSHAADAFRMFGVAFREAPTDHSEGIIKGLLRQTGQYIEEMLTQTPHDGNNNTSWMG